MSTWKQRLARPELLVVCGASLLVWLSRFRFPAPVAEGGLDPSWMQAIAHAFEQRWLAGVEWLFTVGPLGCFHNPVYASGLFWTEILVWQCGVGLAVAVLITARLLKLRRRFERVFAIVLLVLIPIEPDAYAFLAIVAATMWIQESPTLRRPAAVTGLVLLAAFALAKFTFLALIAVCLGAIAVAWWRARSWRAACAVLGAETAIVLALWLLCGQSLANIAPYLSGSLEIAAGYNAAMSTTPDMHGLIAAAAASACFAVVAVACTSARPRSTTRIAGALALLAAWLVAYKAGFTRGDHSATFFTFACVAPFFLLDAPDASARRRTVAHTARLCCVAAALLGPMFGPKAKAPGPRALVVGAARNFGGNASRLFHLSALERELEDQRVWLKSEYGLPQIRAIVGDATVDAVSYDVGRLLLAELNWKPRLTLQGYAAYTPRLLAANADCLRGARAPQYVLFDPRTIDLRLPMMDDGEVMKVLARDYRPLLIEDGRMLLHHEPRTDPPSAPELLVDRTIAFDEVVDIASTPGKCHLIALDIDLTLLGRMRTAMLNAPRMILELKTDDGELRRFRIVPSMIHTGVILNPLILEVADWVRFGSGNRLPRVLSVRLVQTSSPWMFDPKVQMRLFRADDLVPSWSIDQPPFPDRAPGEPARLSVQTLSPVADPVWRIDSEEPVRTVTTGTRSATVVHAPGRMWIPVGAGRHRLRCDVGLAPLAREPGCRAQVRVSVLLAHGTSRTTLFERDLDGGRAEDLVEVPIDVEFETAAPAWIWLSTRDRGRDTDCAWTYWGRPRLE